MFCTNCGAKVDDQAKFCPVCGNKLGERNPGNDQAPQNHEGDLIDKSTFTSANTNENIIEEEKIEKQRKKGKISGFFSNIKFKKPGTKESLEEKEEILPDQKIEVPEGKSELSTHDPVESLDQRLLYEDDLHPNYYGYEPMDDRMRKDQRHQNNQGFYPYDSEIEANIGKKMSRNQAIAGKEEQVKSQSFEPASPKQSQPAENNITYDDIPAEHLEARIARQLRAEATGRTDQSYASGNIAAVIRNNQKNNYPHQEAYTQPKPSTGQAEDPIKEAYPNQNQAQENQYMAQANNDPASSQYQGVNSEDQVDEETDKKKFEFKPLYLIPIILLLLGIVAGIWWMNRAPEDVEVDLSEYIDVTFDGDDGAAIPNASINTSKLLSDYGAKIAYTNKERKNSSYSSPANQFIEELENSTEFRFSKEGNLSNGEEITVMANVSDSSLADDYNVNFLTTMKSVIVDGLITQEYVDPFSYINLEFEGESPNISLITSLTEGAPEYMNEVQITPSKTSELEIGEEVNVSITYDEEQIFNSYGLRFNPTDKIYTVPGETEAEEGQEEEDTAENDQAVPAEGFVSSVDSLDEDLLGTLKYDAGQLIRQTFESRSFTEITSIDYLGAITGSDPANDSLKNRVMLIYEITANEDYEGKYTKAFKYYSFVEYQNVRDSKDENGSFYTEGPITTDNQIFHKFFVEDDFTYYEIPYYGFGFLEEVLARVNNALSGLEIDDSIAVDVTQYWASTDGVAGEYQGNNTRLSLKEDGSVRYKIDNRVHEGTWQESDGNVSLTIEGVNVDTPITATFENGALQVPEQGEMGGQTFNKMQAMS